MPQENRPALVVVPGLKVEHVDASDWMPSYRRSHGATPLYPPLSLVESDMGTDAGAEATVDALLAAQDDARWGASWFARYLGGGDAA